MFDYSIFQIVDSAVETVGVDFGRVGLCFGGGAIHCIFNFLIALCV